MQQCPEERQKGRMKLVLLSRSGKKARKAGRLFHWETGKIRVFYFVQNGATGSRESLGHNSFGRHTLLLTLCPAVQVPRVTCKSICRKAGFCPAAICY